MNCGAIDTTNQPCTFPAELRRRFGGLVCGLRCYNAPRARRRRVAPGVRRARPELFPISWLEARRCWIHLSFGAR